MQSADLKPDLQESLPTLFQLHGVLVRVFDRGVLILGESGTGKSDCALNLIRKGHQLVADDVVEVFDKDGILCGRPTDFTRGLMEIRGMGIVDVSVVLGEGVLLPGSSIDLCIEINESAAVDRFGAARHEHVLGGVRIPKFIVPPGVGLATTVETAVREYQANREALTITT